MTEHVPHHHDPRRALSRRAFLTHMGQAAWAMSVGGASLRAWAASPAPGGGKSQLIVRVAEPQNFETPVPRLTTWITPTEWFYVRSHRNTPSLVGQDWRLRVDGLVEQPLTLTLEALQQFPAVSQVVTLECTGNGRAFFDPKVLGEQWERGALGTARWTGVRLADVLQRAGLQATGRHVRLDGADGPADERLDYVRSLPREKALHPDTLLAYEMNGAPLPVPHGYPLRLIVPGWTGNHSVKWLTHLQVLAQEDDGHYMQNEYRLPTTPVPPGTSTAQVNRAELEVITSLAVKSVITSPGEGAQVSVGRVHVTGVAYAGEAEIVRVEVSTDAGHTWQPATLGPEQARWAWRQWAYDWEVRARGAAVVLSRATDASGRVQPLAAVWNPWGYLWHAVDRVHLTVI
jgi:sulfite oxidase